MAKISQLDTTGYHGYDTGGTERITLDSATGMAITDSDSYNVLKAIISGANAGDVQIGTFVGTGSNPGAYYDKSAGTFKVSGAIMAGSIAIGTSPLWFKVDANGNIWLGHNDFASAPFRVSNAGNLVANNATITGVLTANAGSDVKADYITSGLLSGSSVQSSDRDDKIALTNGDNLEFYQGGVLRGRIRSATAGYGMVATVGSFVTKEDEGFFACINSSFTDFLKLYAKSNVGGSPAGILMLPNSNRMFLTKADGTTLQSWSDSVVYMNKDTEINGNLNMSDHDINGVNQITLYDLRLTNGKSRFAFKDVNGNEQFSISPTGGGNTQIDMNGKYLRLNTNKTAIVPTSEGYKALYCAESPETWFFDFCETKETIDPMFLEVTEGDIKFIKLEDGTYQVWRRRRGKADLRFTPKTAEQFNKNEAFYKQSN